MRYAYSYLAPVIGSSKLDSLTVDNWQLRQFLFFFLHLFTHRIMLQQYIMLYYAILCYIVLYCAILCYIMLYYAILCYIMVYYAILCYIMIYYAILCYIVLYYARHISYGYDTILVWQAVSAMVTHQSCYSSTCRLQTAGLRVLQQESYRYCWMYIVFAFRTRTSRTFEERSIVQQGLRLPYLVQQGSGDNTHTAQCCIIPATLIMVSSAHTSADTTVSVTRTATPRWRTR